MQLRESDVTSILVMRIRCLLDTMVQQLQYYIDRFAISLGELLSIIGGSRSRLTFVRIRSRAQFERTIVQQISRDAIVSIDR